MFDKNAFKGSWNQFKGEIKRLWGKLTDDELTQIEGDYDKLIGKIQERYGRSKEEIQRQLEESYNRWQMTRQPTRK